MDGRRDPIIKQNPNSTQSDPKRIPKSTKALTLCLSLSLSLSVSLRHEAHPISFAGWRLILWGPCAT